MSQDEGRQDATLPGEELGSKRWVVTEALHAEHPSVVSRTRWPARYEIRVESIMHERWSDWFDGLQIEILGDATVLSGTLQISRRCTESSTGFEISASPSSACDGSRPMKSKPETADNGTALQGTARKVPLGVAAANLRNGRGHDRDRERVKLASRGCEDEPPARKRSRISAVGRLGLRGVQSVVPRVAR